MENRAGKVVSLGIASVALVGATLVLEPVPACASFSPSAHVFETRPHEKVRPAEIPLPVESRPASPMPYAGNEFSVDPMETLVKVDTLPPERPEAEAPVPEARTPRHSFSALTSFDGNTEMTSGERDPRIASSSRTFPPQPAQWNNPIRWLSTHHE